MTRQEEISEGMREILTEDLIICGSTHENAPPHKDCGEDCDVSTADQIASANPLFSPMRSGGMKHKRCMDCWNEYVNGLTVRIIDKLRSQGVVIEE